MEKKIDIFEYTDFRKFLEISFESINKLDKKFSKALICREMGVPNSRSYFTDIVSGSRTLSTMKMESLITVFELMGDEAQYFRLMVQFNQTIVPDEKQFYLEQMLRMNKAPKTSLDPRLFSYYTKWYNSALRALLDVIDWKDDYKMLGKLLVPAISEEDAQDAIALLEDLELISANENGFMKPTNQLITSGNAALKNEIIKQYQAKCLNLSIEAIFSAEFVKKNISTKTLSLSENAFNKLTETIAAFRQEVSAIVHNDDEPADRIYQLNIQLFSQSK